MESKHIYQQIIAEYPGLETVIGRENALKELEIQLGNLISSQMISLHEALEIREEFTGEIK